MSKRKPHQELIIAAAPSPCYKCRSRTRPPEPDCHDPARCDRWRYFKEECARVRAEKRREDIPRAMLAENKINRKDRFIKSDDR